MNNTDLLAHYRKELRRSKKWRGNKAGYDDDWKRYIALYSGKHYDTKSGADRLTVNLVFATKNVMAPAVAIHNPRFVLSAQKPETQGNAVVTEEVLNYLWRANRYQAEFRLSVDDWLLCGHGWLKVGYKFVKEAEIKPVESDDEPFNSDSGDTIDEGIDDREDIPGNVESEMNVHDDRPFVERVSIFDMYVDPDARHPKEMRWIAQRTWRPVQDVKVDSRYSATQRQRVATKSHSKWDEEDGDGRSAGTGTDDDRPDRGSIGYAEIIEFYDIKRGTTSTFSMDGGGEENEQDAGFLIKPGDMPYAFGSPFVMLRNYEVPDHFYPIGDVEQIESLQLELNETRNQILNYRKKFRRAWVYAKDRFDRDGVAALESDEDNVMIPVQGDADPSSSLAPVPAVITPSEFFDQSAMISNDLDRVSGVSDYQRGAQTAIKRTATEASMIQDAANSRAQDRLAKIEDILAQVGERVVGLMQQYMTGDRVARITSVPGMAWVNYDEDYIQGKFDFSVAAGSTEPQNETFRRQSAMQLVDASMPFLEMGVANPMALYQHILQKGFGIQDTSNFLQQPEPEMPEGMGQVGGPPPESRDSGQPMPQMGGAPAPLEGEISPEMLMELLMGQQQQQGPPPGMPPEMMQGLPLQG